MTRRYQIEVASLGITAPQAGLLFFLDKAGPSCQSSLARILRLDKANVNSMVRKLEAKGLVRQERDEADARRSKIALTERGREMAPILDKADREVGKELEALAGGAREEAAIRAFLEAIVFPEGCDEKA